MSNHVTLYIPGNPVPEEYDVESAHVDASGVMRFRFDDHDVVTTVPFLVRYPVKAKAVVTEQRSVPPRRDGGAWS